MLDHRTVLEDHSSAVPRYTSYPTAPHFKPEIGSRVLAQTISSLPVGERISLYVHIPFCDRLCWFCGCNTKQVNRYNPVAKYVDVLVREIELAGENTGGNQPLAQVHFGGGSPSLLHTEDFAKLSLAINNAFDLDGDTRISVEIDPNDASEQLYRGLNIIGLTRASIGVQDFDPAVQQAINRPQTFEDTSALVGNLRAAGVRSINIDALYGLPLQTMDRLRATIEQVIRMDPDRIAMFGYAHVPWIKKHQKMIRDEDLPGTHERFEQAQLAENLLIHAGYTKIGIDHFAKPGDPLAQAAQNGRLRRNFQGYTDDQFNTLIGLGASSIGQSDLGYYQNLVPTGQYMLAVENGLLPAARGYYLTRDDKIRSWMIERLMCDFEVSFEALSREFGNDAASYIKEAMCVGESDQYGLCHVSADGLVIVPEARPFTRIVASKFDAHLKETEFRYSRAV